MSRCTQTKTNSKAAKEVTVSVNLRLDSPSSFSTCCICPQTPIPFVFLCVQPATGMTVQASLLSSRVGASGLQFVYVPLSNWLQQGMPIPRCSPSCPAAKTMREPERWWLMLSSNKFCNCLGQQNLLAPEPTERNALVKCGRPTIWV